VPKPVEIDTDKLRMKFSALNLDFDGPSLYFLFSLSLKRLQIGMGMLLIKQALVTSFSVVSTSMTLKDLTLSK